MQNEPTDPQAELREQITKEVEEQIKDGLYKLVLEIKFNGALGVGQAVLGLLKYYNDCYSQHLNQLLATERERATEKIILNLYQNNLVEKDKHSSDFDMVHVHVPRLRFIITEALKKGTE